MTLKGSEGMRLVNVGVMSFQRKGAVRAKARSWLMCGLLRNSEEAGVAEAKCVWQAWWEAQYGGSWSSPDHSKDCSKGAFQI